MLIIHYNVVLFIPSFSFSTAVDWKGTTAFNVARVFTEKESSSRGKKFKSIIHYCKLMTSCIICCFNTLILPNGCLLELRHHYYYNNNYCSLWRMFSQQIVCCILSTDARHHYPKKICICNLRMAVSLEPEAPFSITLFCIGCASCMTTWIHYNLLTFSTIFNYKSPLLITNLSPFTHL